MKIYLWDNEGEHDFNTRTLLEIEDKYSSGQHSGGIVVLADNVHEAIGFVMLRLGLTSEKSKAYLEKTVDEDVKMEKGVIYYGDGDC